MRPKATAALVLVVVIGTTAGLLQTRPGEQARELLQRAWGPSASIVAGVPRTEVDCPREPHPRTMVVLTFGQSNAANYVRGRHESAARVVNFFDGSCYAGKDPLPGAGGTGGSVWSRLGDLLVAGGDFDQVVIAGVAVSASGISRWTVGGDLHRRLLETLESMRVAGLTPTHLLWHQGETDAKDGTGAEAYRRQFLAMIDSLRARGFVAPVFVATATYCHGRSSAALRAAQAALVDPGAGIHAGPDTDALVGSNWRDDDCHFSEAGATRHAELWRDALRASPARQ